jgi:Ca2+-binding EF-hand superfamily protein
MYCRESKNKLYEILFDIYDLDNDGFIDVKEL